MAICRLLICLLILLSTVAFADYPCHTPSTYTVSSIRSAINFFEVDPKFTIFLAPVIYRAAAKYDVNPFIIVAILDKETDFRLNVLGKDGEVGIAQIMPFWAKKFGYTVNELADPETNIDTCARILRLHLNRFKDRFKAVRAYNGQNRRGTLYAKSVLKTHNRLEKL